MIALRWIVLEAPDPNGPPVYSAFQHISIEYGSFTSYDGSKVIVFREEGRGDGHNDLRDLKLVKCGKYDRWGEDLG